MEHRESDNDRSFSFWPRSNRRRLVTSERRKRDVSSRRSLVSSWRLVKFEAGSKKKRAVSVDEARPGLSVRWLPRMGKAEG